VVGSAYRHEARTSRYEVRTDGLTNSPRFIPGEKLFLRRFCSPVAAPLVLALLPADVLEGLRQWVD